MHIRKDALVIGENYHVLDRSIAGFRIFNNRKEYLRMINAIRYYQMEKPPVRLSRFLETAKNKNGLIEFTNSGPKLVDIIAYSIMPTHLHLILKQLTKHGISVFMSNILNSYTRYFNSKHERKGPLWEDYFKNVLIESDDQLLHLTRYIHLNPATAYLVNRPQDWFASSYKEYLSEATDNNKICNYAGLLEIEPKSYRSFVESNIEHQRELAKIKDIILE